MMTEERNTRFALGGARIFTGDAFVEDHAVIISGNRIAGVVPAASLSGVEVRDLHGGLLAPGFIDVQVNGGGGALLNERPTAETIRTIAASHRRFGTVAMLPTVITDAPRILEEAAEAVREARAQGIATVLGLHIEGPFLDVARKGAHAARFIRRMTEEDADWLISLGCGTLMVTVAPNSVDPSLVRRMAERGVIVSLGHSDASYAEATAALRAGARGFTHLFNAMSQMNGREAGLVGAALTDRDSYAGIIADGHHVHDAALKVALAAKPPSRIMLVTDAMPSAAGGPPAFGLQGRKVSLSDGRLTLPDGTLAGSSLTMDAAVRYCVERLDVALADALRMASLTPAAFLGRAHELGRIAPGHLASLVHLDDQLRVKATWVEGA